MLSGMTLFTNFKMKKEQIKFLVRKAVGDSMSDEQMCPNLKWVSYTCQNSNWEQL